MADIYWGDGIHEERLPLLEDAPEEKKKELSPEEKDFIEQLLSLLEHAPEEEKKKELSPEEKEFIEQSLYEIARSCFQ